MMHMLGPAYTTLSTRKRKSKDTTVNAKFAKEFADYNKQMKKLGSKTKTLEEYIAYRQGKSKIKLKGGVKDPLTATTHRRESPVVPSYGELAGTIPAKPEQRYTGTLIKGLAVTHKSNIVPVMNQQQAEDIARMRRG